MLLENFFPSLPETRLDILIMVVSALGAVLLIYSQFVEAENRRDLIRMIGAAGLAVYAISLLNLLFIITTVGIFLASLVEFIEIYLGLHHHDRKDI